MFVTPQAAVSFAVALFLFLSLPGQAQSPTQPFAPKASLFLIGGAADTVLADFVRIAGGGKAHIVIIPFASEEPHKSADTLENDFTALNAGKVTIVMPNTNATLPSDTTAIYMTGGDQSRLKKLLKDPLRSDLAKFSGIIGGSSAGAMIASSPMIAGGMDSSTVRAGRLRITEGLGLLPNVIVDTHVGARARDTRSLAALALIQDAKMAIGLDEDTAVYIKEGKGTVYGAGHARLYRRTPTFASNIANLKPGELADVKDVLYSVLAPGDQFDLP